MTAQMIFLIHAVIYKKRLQFKAEVQEIHKAL